MAVAYHHIDEYEDVMPTPTNDVEIFRNTKFSQQWDKKIHETTSKFCSVALSIWIKV